MLNPFVTLLRRARLPRGAAVADRLPRALAGRSPASASCSPTRSPTRSSSFRDDVPEIVDDANDSLADLQELARRQRRRHPGQRAGPDRASSRSATASPRARASSSPSRATRSCGSSRRSIALILILVLSIYMLLYGERIGAAVRSVMPPGDGTPEDDFPTRVQRAVFGYVRGQLLFSLIMGTGAGSPVRARLARDLPARARPTRSPSAPSSASRADPLRRARARRVPAGAGRAVQRRPLDALWVAILFIALQQIEGHIVAPNVFGHALRINPLLVIFALLLGGQIYGIIGAFMALPIAAVAARDGRLPAPPPRARAVAARARGGARRASAPRRQPARSAARRRAAGDPLRGAAGPSWAAPTSPRSPRQPGRRDVAADAAHRSP